ncbi:hypothetical protein SAMN05444000_107172 [Shimia gijangensis]|uniref:Uncharacterized protein n=1 Tax=Shimia gijangensis TaxID=1470563 RepID=A0A1M6IMM9_9RHOB|nr:hypothetical protein [Shimia gijangensis]SHJ35697.1 hypothetical protein SAMN05444000_107172 [Shimia gijangensis]
MYALAFTTVRYNIAFYAIVTLVVVMLEMLMSAAGVVTLVFMGLTMLYTHRMIQLNEIYGWTDPMSTTGRDGSKIPLFGYVLRFCAYFVALMLILAGAFMALEATGVLNPDAFLSEIEYGMWGMLVGVPVFACALAIVGTVLPACAERADTSLKTAFLRGRKTFGRTVLNLIAGPLVVAFVGFFCLGQIGWLLGGFDNIIGRSLFRIAATILAILPAMLTATALSMAYLKAEKGR